MPACVICGKPSTKVLRCRRCHFDAAHLCDGFVCQPRIWQVERSVVALMQLSCEKCDGRLELIEGGTLYLMLTCDWEGRADVQTYYGDMRVLRQQLRKLSGMDVPITHFITPRSYNKTLAGVISGGDVVLPCDEIGLHIHCWTDVLTQIDLEESTHLVEEAAKLNATYESCKADGKDTPLVAFSPKSVATIVRWYHTELRRISGVAAKSFRGGAWFASDAVYDALGECGVVIDSSPSPLKLIKYPDKEVEGLLQQLWGPVRGDLNTFTHGKLGGAVQIDSQPFSIRTRAHKDIGVFPMTWGMDVNAKVEAIVGWLREEIVWVKAGHTRYVNFGFHDTLISKRGWAASLVEALLPLLQENIQFEWVTVSQAGARRWP